MDEKLKRQLLFLTEIDRMKNVMRQTLLMDKSRQETDAEHSWHFAVMALTLFEYSGLHGVNIDRVVRMALLHDLIEIYAGDTFAYDVKANEDKQERELMAADRLFSLLPLEQGEEYRALWLEFDEMLTPDAMYAAAIDRLQPFLSNHMTDGHTWVKHGVSLEQVLKRMAPVKTALPALWEFIEIVIEESCEKGYIKTQDDGTEPS